MRNRCLNLLSTLGMLACTGKRLLVGEDGAGGRLDGHRRQSHGHRRRVWSGGRWQRGHDRQRSGGNGGTTASGLGGNVAGGTTGAGGTALASLTLLAGGIGGPGTADGNGTTARFYFPVAVVSDGAGNLYVADSVNGTIRKIAIATGASPRSPATRDRPERWTGSARRRPSAT